MAPFWIIFLLSKHSCATVFDIYTATLQNFTCPSNSDVDAVLQFSVENASFLSITVKWRASKRNSSLSLLPLHPSRSFPPSHSLVSVALFWLLC